MVKEKKVIKKEGKIKSRAEEAHANDSNQT